MKFQVLSWYWHYLKWVEEKYRHSRGVNEFCGVCIYTWTIQFLGECEIKFVFSNILTERSKNKKIKISDMKMKRNKAQNFLLIVLLPFQYLISKNHMNINESDMNVERMR